LAASVLAAFSAAAFCVVFWWLADVVWQASWKVSFEVCVVAVVVFAFVEVAVVVG
jgi:hypothetical protein